MMRHWTWLLALLGAFALVAAGCGDGSGDDDDDDMIDGGPVGDDDDDVVGDDDDDSDGCWGDPCSSPGAALTECPGTPASARSCVAEANTSIITGTGDIGDPDEEPVRSSNDLDTDLSLAELPGGEVAEVVQWAGGYCFSQGVAGADGCNVAADCNQGDECRGRCLNLGTDGGGNVIGGCFLACNPGAAGNGDCRDNYECRADIGGGSCWPGCSNDLECQVAREDTNGDGFIDPYDFETNTLGDRLVFDEDSEAFCDTADRGGSFDCINPGTEGVSPGDACERSSQCMENGTCIIEAPPAGSTAPRFTDGYCIELNCVNDDSCGEGGICQSKGFGNDACLQSCEFAAEVVDGEFGEGAFGTEEGPGNSPGCRPGYHCEWNGELTLDGDVRTDGACLPGVYNEITEPTLGENCVSDRDCFSPMGNGECRQFVSARDGAGNAIAFRGFCIVTDCRPDEADLRAVLPDTTPVSAAVALAPGVPEKDVYCGAGATCLPVGGDIIDGNPPAETQCFKTCDTADECGNGFACNPTLIDFEDNRGLCWIDCIDRDDPNGDGVINLDDRDSSLCRAGEVCSAVNGICEPG